jgi:hypothetical protein
MAGESKTMAAERCVYTTLSPYVCSEDINGGVELKLYVFRIWGTAVSFRLQTLNCKETAHLIRYISSCVDLRSGVKAVPLLETDPRSSRPSTTDLKKI